MAKKKNKIVPILFGVILILVLVAGFFVYKYFETVNNDQAHQAKTLVKRISRYLDLPNEEATVATIVDKNKLNNQTLRQRAENEDKLLIFSQAKRVILYRPSTDKVIEMLTIQDSGQDIGVE